MQVPTSLWTAALEKESGGRLGCLVLVLVLVLVMVPVPVLVPLVPLELVPLARNKQNMRTKTQEVQ